MMKPLRILLLSASRPSRTWKIAKRIAREIPGAEVCRIVQQPLHLLPLTQQWIASGGDFVTAPPSCGMARIAFELRRRIKGLLHWVLWFVHGCPSNLNAPEKFTIEKLAQECEPIGCELCLLDYADSSLLEFSRQDVDLLVVLGELPHNRIAWVAPERGVLWAHQDEPATACQPNRRLQIRIEHFNRDLRSSVSMASLALPVQPYDGPCGMALKADLIADDLLIQVIAGLQKGSIDDAAEGTSDWLRKTMVPYLDQYREMQAWHQPEGQSIRRSRPAWKLCLDTALLCSPLFIVRNWYRRWRGRYPVLILSHHLVSDRPHRMGLSTEHFWSLMQFLQRHYRFIGLADVPGLLRAGKIKTPMLAITFDDGYRDNFVNLRAVANEMDIPVTSLITTQPVDLGCEFRHDLENGSTGHFALTWDQIRYWGGCGGGFGSHTRTHTDCSVADGPALIDELAGSKQDLELELGTPVEFFAFPFGRPHDVTAQAFGIAAATYSYVLSDHDGDNLPCAGNNPYLFRKDLYLNRWELELELQSVFRLINRWKRKFRRVPKSVKQQKGFVVTVLAHPEKPSSSSAKHGFERPL